MKKTILAVYAKSGEKLFKDKNVFLSISRTVAATVTARYYKGISAAGDNVVIVYEKDNSDRSDG